MSLQSAFVAADERLRDEPVTVTVREAQRLSGLGNTSIYQAIKDGRLKSTTVGRRRLIDYRSLLVLIECR